jgi:hypothetical protein
MQAVMELQRGKGAPQKTISTKNILFIMSGAFEALPEIIRKRAGKGPIGFVKGPGDSDYSDDEWLHAVQTRDFITYGFEPEFIGRLPVRVICDPLSVDDLEAVMRQSEGSILRQYERDFSGYGIDIRFEYDAIRRVAEKAHDEKTGARGLMTVLERALRDYKFELPSTACRSLSVSADVIENPRQRLAQILDSTEDLRLVALEGELQTFLDNFAKDHGVKLQISASVSSALLQDCVEADQSLAEYWNAHFADMEYGFRLLATNTGKKTFRLTRAFIDDPGKILSDWVAKSFQNKK